MWFCKCTESIWEEKPWIMNTLCPPTQYCHNAAIHTNLAWLKSLLSKTLTGLKSLPCYWPVWCEFGMVQKVRPTLLSRKTVCASFNATCKNLALLVELPLILPALHQLIHTSLILPKMYLLHFLSTKTILVKNLLVVLNR